MWAPPLSQVSYMYHQVSLSGFLSSHSVDRFVNVAEETGVALAFQRFHNQFPSWQHRNLSCKHWGAWCSAPATSAGLVRRSGWGRQSARELQRLPQTDPADCSLREAENASRLKNQSLALIWTYSAQHQKYKSSTFVFKRPENLYKLSFPQVLPCHSSLPPPRTFFSPLSHGSLLMRPAQ